MDGREGPPPEEAPRLLIDEMLGRLGRWLRVLGYDAEDAAGRDDDELLRIAEAEERVLLTRDTGLVGRRPVNRGRVRALLVEGDHLEEQLDQLREQLPLRFVGPPRCLVCNSALRVIGREEARGRVPAYVYSTQRDFRYCPVCRRVVWPGSHWREMQRVLAERGILLRSSPGRSDSGASADTHRPPAGSGRKE